MSTAGVKNGKSFMALLGFLFVLSAPPPVWSGAPPSPNTGIMPHYEMMGHTEEALNASRNNELRGATNHAQLALKAGESYLATTKPDPDKQKVINEGIQSLKEALKYAQSGDSKGFENSVATAMSKFSPDKDCKDGGHGPGCVKAACGCGAQLMQTCDPLHPTRRCTTVGCDCYCM